MKIVDCNVVPFKGVLSSPVGNSKRIWNCREGICIVLEGDEGHIGIGEASPLSGYSPDTFRQSFQALKSIQRAMKNLEIDPNTLSVESAAALFDSFQVSWDEVPSARFAIETALLDLWGKVCGIPLNRFFPNRGSHEKVPINGVVSLDQGLSGALSSVESLVQEGIQTIKIKIGNRSIGFGMEYELLSDIRAQIGDWVNIRLDVNGAWNHDEAVEWLPRYQEIKPCLVEEPVCGNGLLELSNFNTPIGADESLVNQALVSLLISSGTCSAFVLKPALLGGLIRTHELACEALGAGIDVIISHMWDGPIGLAACRELAFGLPRTPLACGLALHSGLSIWPDMTPYLLIKDGYAHSIGSEGLGLDGREFVKGLS